MSSQAETLLPPSGRAESSDKVHLGRDAPNPKTRGPADAGKETYWRKWIDIYNTRMAFPGRVPQLYVCGYDVPEGACDRKDGRMYYAFFSPDPKNRGQGEIELRGLKPGRYRIRDYENAKIWVC